MPCYDTRAGLQLVEAEYGDDTVFWFDEHFTYQLQIPETVERAEWYEVTGWPYVRIDGCRTHVGIVTPEEVAYYIGIQIDHRIDETGGMSPVAITGSFRADDSNLEWDIEFELVDPIVLTDLRGTFVAIEDDVVDGGTEMFPRVTRAIQYEEVSIDYGGGTAHFVVTIPRDPSWQWENMRAVVFLQQLTEDYPIIQGLVLPNDDVVAAVDPTDELTQLSRIETIAPNPFTVSTRVSFRLSENAVAGPVLLEILDPLGRRVREIPITASHRNSGQGMVMWDGKSDAGVPAPVGSYYFRLRTEDGENRGKVILIR
jgi:FlgD Ig-like domain